MNHPSDPAPLGLYRGMAVGLPVGILIWWVLIRLAMTVL